MYQVVQHRIGKNGTIDTLGRLWETGGGYPAFEPIWECRRKLEAFAAADACVMKATVHRNHAAFVEYDNGKEPGRRERDFRVTPPAPKRPIPSYSPRVA